MIGFFITSLLVALAYQANEASASAALSTPYYGNVDANGQRNYSMVNGNGTQDRCFKVIKYYCAVSENQKPTFTTPDAFVCATACNNSSCSAATYNKQTQGCTLSHCAVNGLTKDENCITLVYGDPVIGGTPALPRPTHNFMLTDQCGCASQGPLANSFIGLKITVEKVMLTKEFNPLIGKALNFGDADDDKLQAAKFNHSLSLSSVGNNCTTVAFFVLLAPSQNPLNLFAFHSQDKTLQYGFDPKFNSIFINTHSGGRITQRVSHEYKCKPKSWHHVAFSYNGETRMHSTYINGKEIGKQRMEYLGLNPIHSLTIGGGNFGAICCLSIFNTLLDQTQIKEHQRGCQKGQIYFNT